MRKTKVRKIKPYEPLREGDVWLDTQAPAWIHENGLNEISDRHFGFPYIPTADLYSKDFILRVETVSQDPLFLRSLEKPTRYDTTKLEITPTEGG